MEKIFLAISMKEKKTKIAVFQIDKNNDIFINEVHIINSFISESKPQKNIKKILKNFTIYQTVISIYNDCSKDYKKALESFDFKYELYNELFIMNEAIKVIGKNELKSIKTKLKYIENGWLDFSQIKHIDLNGLIHYKLNNRG
jgi:ribosome-interacting GTPase 1